MKIERVVVTGGRKFNDGARIEADLRALLPFGLCRVAQGNADGADALAAHWALRWLRHDGGLHGYPADWNADGKAAGPRRNTRMLEAEKPDLVLAYPDETSRGTWHCVAEALARHIPVIGWLPWAPGEGLYEFNRSVAGYNARLRYRLCNFTDATVAAWACSTGEWQQIDPVLRALEAVR